MKMLNRRDRFLYVLNASLLFSHEIDFAYWHEWELFGIPGGIQAFVILNFGLILFFLAGYQLLLASWRGGYAVAELLAGAGVFAFAIHTTFLLHGHPAFRLPVSVLLLVFILVASLVQGYWAVGAKAKAPESLVRRQHRLSATHDFHLYAGL